MCGRTACALEPAKIQQKCKYENKQGKEEKPEWKLNTDRYKAGHNVAPTSYCPVLISSHHLESKENHAERSLACMRWGLVPNWMGNSHNGQFSMNNARSDTMLEKKSYKNPLKKGQRCVVLAEGFYEWKAVKSGKKQPYFIHLPKDEKEKSEAPLLAMAGIFEKAWVDDEDLYSFSVITVDSHENFSCIHHRMPAILESDEEINSWLDYRNVSLDEAVKLIKSKPCLTWYPVDRYVSNSRNQGAQCREQISLDQVEKNQQKKLSASANSMMSWLSSKTVKSPLSQNVTPKKRKPAATIEKFFIKKSKE